MSCSASAIKSSARNGSSEEPRPGVILGTGSKHCAAGLKNVHSPDAQAKVHNMLQSAASRAGSDPVKQREAVVETLGVLQDWMASGQWDNFL